MYGQVIYDQIADKAGLPCYKCHLCGKWVRGLGYHIYHKHKITSREYKKMFGLDLKQSLLGTKEKLNRRNKTLENKTYLNLAAGEAQRQKVKTGVVKLANYKRSEQTKKRIKNNLKNKPKEIELKL